MKQKVLLYTERGLNDPNIELFKREYFFQNFEPIAILTPEDQLPNSILQKIPIVLLESTDFDRFLKLGAPRKIMRRDEKFRRYFDETKGSPLHRTRRE